MIAARSSFATVFLWLLLLPASLCFGADGVALVPDPGESAVLVNKNVGNGRWAIDLTAYANLLVDASPVLVVRGVTGNVFFGDEAPPQFLECDLDGERTAVPHVLVQGKDFFFDCRATTACSLDPSACQFQWSDENVMDPEVPASFFLPPTGDSLSSATSVTASQAAQLVERPRGVAVTRDGAKYLISKDLGGQRWSISVSLPEVRSDDGSTWVRSPKRITVAGNVFPVDGSPPQFVYCETTPESDGSLANSQSMFELACWGTTPCVGQSVLDCAENWESLGVVQRQADFFLPDVGVSPFESDAAMSIIEQPFGLPWIATETYQPALQQALSGLVAGGCAVGSPCIISRIGECADVEGVLIRGDDGCLCQVQDWDLNARCVACGAGDIDGTCGGTCEFAVAAATARGVCLPISSASETCFCHAASAGSAGQSPVRGCGGRQGATCPSGLCCRDDPRDACDSSANHPDCPGVCVDVDGACDPAQESCGSCQENLCGNTLVEPVEECDGDDLAGYDCVSLGYEGGALRCTADCTFDVSRCSAPCGDSIRQPDEACDGPDLDGQTCGSLGLGEGELTCSGDCTFNTSQCGCGNGVVDASEECDGADLNGESCASQGRGNGTLACRSDCTFDYGDCPLCGNGQLDPGEECDGFDLGGASCEDDGFCGGELRCDDQCRWDATGCFGDGELALDAQCETSACCNSNLCAATGFDPSDKICINPPPRLGDECSEASCSSPLLSCGKLISSVEFCCWNIGAPCAEDNECCSSNCNGGICE